MLSVKNSTLAAHKDYNIKIKAMIGKFEGHQEGRLVYPFTSQIIRPVEISTQVSDDSEHSSPVFSLISTGEKPKHLL